MKNLRIKLAAASAALIVAASPVLAAEVSRGSEGNGETPRSALGARSLSERAINLMPRVEDGISSRSLELDRAAYERGIGTLGRKASGETFSIPASTELKQAL
jgi:hypothetical protein